MFFEIVCIAVLASPSLAGVARSVKRADEVYQEQLRAYLATQPKAIAEEALMTVVSNICINNNNALFGKSYFVYKNI